MQLQHNELYWVYTFHMCMFQLVFIQSWQLHFNTFVRICWGHNVFHPSSSLSSLSETLVFLTFFLNTWFFFGTCRCQLRVTEQVCIWFSSGGFDESMEVCDSDSAKTQQFSSSSCVVSCANFMHHSLSTSDKPSASVLTRFFYFTDT